MLYRTDNTLESCPIVYFDLEGNYQGEFESICKASRILNVYRASIMNNLERKNLRVKNYIFLERSKYKKDMKLSYKGLKAKRKFIKIYYE